MHRLRCTTGAWRAPSPSDSVGGGYWTVAAAGSPAGLGGCRGLWRGGGGGAVAALQRLEAACLLPPQEGRGAWRRAEVAGACGQLATESGS